MVILHERVWVLAGLVCGIGSELEVARVLTLQEGVGLHEHRLGCRPSIAAPKAWLLKPGCAPKGILVVLILVMVSVDAKRHKQALPEVLLPLPALLTAMAVLPVLAHILYRNSLPLVP
mmetsp:Transcript_30562/g.79591  ORF Transcript_30562/g.79591 Transcript_30562/m.79591 type:complete len:118 (-) Transcript_30562:476-829(-)